jgi:hypothetical protein
MAFGDAPGLPGAAAELAQDVPGLELGAGPLAGRAEPGVGAVGGFLGFWIRAAVRSCTLPGSGPEIHWMSPEGVEMTCRFMPWRRCFPE